MTYLIELWEDPEGRCPVEKFIKSIPKKAKGKMIKILDLIEQYGEKVQMPHLKGLIGYDILEIRFKFQSINYRIFCVVRDTVFWLMHGFIKNTKHTPKNEIERTLRRVNQLDYSLSNL